MRLAQRRRVLLGLREGPEYDEGAHTSLNRNRWNPGLQSRQSHQRCRLSRNPKNPS